MDGGAWWAAVHGVAKSRTRLSDFTFTFHFHALEKEMATHSSVLAWRIPGAGEPGGLPSLGSHRVGHDCSASAAAAAAAKQDQMFRSVACVCVCTYRSWDIKCTSFQEDDKTALVDVQKFFLFHYLPIIRIIFFKKRTLPFVTL